MAGQAFIKEILSVIHLVGRILPTYAFCPMTFLFRYNKGTKRLLKDTEVFQSSMNRFKEFTFEKALAIIADNV